MDSRLKFNTYFIKIIFFFIVSLLIVQLFRLQVLENRRWAIRADIKNRLNKTFQASRGKILFADGSPLAVSELAYEISALPQGFNDKKVKNTGITPGSFARDIAAITGLDEDAVLKLILLPNRVSVPIARKVSSEVLDQIQKKYPLDLGIWTYVEQTKRVYPDKSVAAKLVGFVGSNEKGEDVGRYGLEEYFDGVLRGSEGILEGKKDSREQVIVNEDFDNISSKNGIDIQLTIDRGIQVMLEERLMYWLDKVKAKEATAVIMEPNTGRIIAAANVPTYDPNKYWEGEIIDCKYEVYNVAQNNCNKIEEVPEENNKDEKKNTYPEGYESRLKEIEDQKRKLEEEEKRLRGENQEEQQEQSNLETKKRERDAKVAAKLQKYGPSVREIFRKESLPLAEVYRDSVSSFTYEPGSVVKVITLATAYNYRSIPVSPDYQLGGHNGCEKVMDRTLCTADKRAKSSLTVEEMLQNSDNVGALRVAQTVKVQDFAETLNKFGLGKGTGIELAAESVFTPKDKDLWTRVDQATAAYGQGSVSYTPIQLTNAWNILASDGKSYKPTLVKQINDNGKIKIFEPQFQEHIISEKAAKDALNISSLATSKGGGPQTKDFYKKYPYAGKTGTANIPDPHGNGYLPDVANTSYIGIAPLDNPKITMLVWFREPRLGFNTQSLGALTTAQPAWLDIAERVMVKMNVVPKNN